MVLPDPLDEQWPDSRIPASAALSTAWEPETEVEREYRIGKLRAKSGQVFALVILFFIIFASMAGSLWVLYWENMLKLSYDLTMMMSIGLAAVTIILWLPVHFLYKWFKRIRAEIDE